MSLRWRRLLAWALLLWLPLQGGVALATGLCLSMRAATGAMAAAVVSPVAESPCPGHAAVAGGEAAVDAALGTPADDTVGPCAHCAACQIHAAGLPATPRLASAPPPEHGEPAPRGAPAERAPDRLERPPRGALA